MNMPEQRKRSRGLSILLTVFALIYGVGAIYLFLSWTGVQSYDSGFWLHASLPFYVLVFLIALIGLYGIWRGRKWGVYCLAASWVLTGVLNSIFVAPRPIPYRASFLSTVMVVTFFLVLMPKWKDLE